MMVIDGREIQLGHGVVSHVESWNITEGCLHLIGKKIKKKIICHPLIILIEIITILFYIVNIGIYSEYRNSEL